MKKLLTFTLSVATITSLPMFANAAAINAGSEGFFIANRASIKCGVTTKHKADLALMFLGYDTNSIKHFESTLKSKIESTLQEPGYCEDFKNTFDNYDPTKDPMMAKFNNKGNNQAVNSTQKTRNYDDCNDARDYEGCVKVKSGQTSASNSAETCKSGWCKSKGGIDKNAESIYITSSKIQGNNLTKNSSSMSRESRKLKELQLSNFFVPGVFLEAFSSKTNK